MNSEENHSVVFKPNIEQERIKHIAGETLENFRTTAFCQAIIDETSPTANFGITDAFEVGFKTQRVEGQIEHRIRIITAVPRPNYAHSENRIPKLLTDTNIEGVVTPEKVKLMSYILIS